MVCLSCGYLSKGIHFLCSYFRIGGASIIAHTAHQINEDKEAKKNQRIVEIKEVRMSPGIDVNDFNVKVRNAQRFLADGNRVKVAVRFRGREMAHTDIGKRLLEKFAADCAEVATMDKEPKLDGRHMTMFLSCRQNKETKK